MLERRVDVERQPGAGVEQDLGTQQRRGRRHRRGVCRAASRGTPGPPSRRRRQGGGAWCAKSGSALPGCFRQRHPELGAVQGGGARRRDLGVADPASGRHQVDLAGPHQGVVARRCRGARSRPVNSQLTVCRPVCGCGATDIPPVVVDLVGAVVVDEAPGPDQRALPLRQGAAHPHRPRPAERHVARRHAPRRRRVAGGADDLAGSRSGLVIRRHSGLDGCPATRAVGCAAPVTSSRRPRLSARPDSAPDRPPSAVSSRTITDFDVGQLLPSASGSSGTSGLVSG